MRGEVILFNRSIVIAGEDIESWGGQIVTSDTYEFMNGQLNFLTGQTILDHVEIYNCSQWDTFKSALRFESASTKYSSVTNSAIHNGLGWGVRIDKSANIYFKDNVIYDFRPIGLTIESSRNITIDGNVMIRVTARTTLGTDEPVEDPSGGFCICSIFATSEQCSDIKVKNNIASGVIFAGFIAPGDKCGETNYGNFYKNVAHSTGGPKYGFGALIYPSDADSSHSSCYEASHFAAYKNYYMGAFGFFKSNNIIFHDMTMVDNREGFGAMLSAGGVSTV